ncbi:MAG: zinc-finger domain-containing protein [Parvularculaceae bacterium]
MNDAAPPPPETIYVATPVVACDGGGGALGHPKVWYSLEDGRAECMYCDRLFILDPAKAAGEAPRPTAENASAVSDAGVGDEASKA